MTKFADVVETIEPDALARVSGGDRTVELQHDATVGGIANVKEIESMDLEAPPGPPVDRVPGEPPPLSPAVQTEYEVVVDNGSGHANSYVKISESQFNADINDAYQNNNVRSDLSSPTPSPPTELVTTGTFLKNEVSMDGLTNVREFSDVTQLSTGANQYRAAVDDDNGNLTVVDISHQQYVDLLDLDTSMDSSSLYITEQEES